MPTRAQMTGMQGVYLVAAELAGRGFVVSPTSRNAAGADLLVTDQTCKNAWSVQVKTNGRRANFWLVGPHARRFISDSHVYVFVNIRTKGRPEYVVAPSAYVAAKVRTDTSSKGSVWHYFQRDDRPSNTEGWELFGSPHLDARSDGAEGSSAGEGSD